MASFTVTLQVQSDLGCSASLSKPITFAGGNAVINAPDTACINVPAASFTNGSTPTPSFSPPGILGMVRRVQWAAPTPKHIPPVGPYTVKLVNKYANCADSITKIVQVVNLPTPAFAASPTASCVAPLTVNFNDLTSPKPASWLWDFGDGSTSTLQNPSHTYTTAGLFDVKLTVTSSAGCSNTITLPKFIQITAPSISFQYCRSGRLRGWADFAIGCW